MKALSQQMVSGKPIKGNRFLKRTLIVVGAIVVIIFAVHFWFVYNARTVLKNYITEQSGGKIKLELSELELNLLTSRLQIQEADLVSTDSLNEPITYHVTFNKLSLKVGSVWALLLQKKLLLDSIKLYDPVIQVMQWRKDTAQVVTKDELSIPQEMGKFYNSMHNALNEFGISRIIVDNAKISLINKRKPGSEPVSISNIFFDLVRSATRKGNENVYIKSNQTIELKTAYQNIALPGGRHHLSFKSFHLQLLRDRIDLDSCTVTAMPTDSIKSSYKIFFKKLSLTGVDFMAMSANNVIKADSVYCENPVFDINLYRTDAVKKKTELPDPDKIIRELTGNLNLAYVGVKNAGIHFDIYGKTKRSFFNSSKDNFEIYGFRINPDSSEPVSIRRFDMTLRDYHLYNEDSSSTFSFDSLHFLNKKIVLNNFEMLSRPGRNKIRNEVDIKVPYFELSQLDWYQLIFEQNMVANAAVLNNPVINFRRRKAGGNGKKINLFAALQNLDSLVALENVSVLNGDVNMQLGPATSFNVQKINFNIYSNKLLQSTSNAGLRSAIEHFSFSKGVLRLKDITAQLQNARFTPNNIVYAEKVTVSGQGNKVTATVNNVHIDNMLLDDAADKVDVDGIGWESANVELKALPKGKNGSNNNSSTIHLRNIEGNNTRLNISSGPMKISTYVQTLVASSLLKQGDDLIRIDGFNLVGNNLAVNTNAVNINADAYNIAGSDPSSLTGVQVQKIQGRDSLKIQSSQVNFTTNLNDLFANDFHLSDVQARALVIKLSKWDTAKVVRDTTTAQIPIRIDKLSAIEPDITIATHLNDSVSIINIPRSDGSRVQASEILISGESMQIGSLVVNTTAATFVKPSGETLGVEKGKIDMDLSNIQFGKKDGKINWSGSINNLSLENANGLSMGKTKNNLRFQRASIGNVNLSSDYLPDFGQLMKANVSAWLRIPQGQFVDSNTTLQWYNADYNNTTRTLSLDSFIYHPTKSLDSTLAHAPYQLDYIAMKTGAVTISGLDVARYEKDTSFIANTITISNPVLTVYRDKKPPSSPHKRDKPLPVNMIKNISLPVSVQAVQLKDGTITYSEKNGKSRKEGHLLLTDVSATLENIKNSNLSNDDSLSLTFNAQLMGTAGIALNLKESYTDTLGGFLLNAKISSADLSVLNPVMVPLSNVKISSGVLDSISIHAVGREDVAFGEMNMRYRKLRIQLVKDGDADQSTFLQKTISFIANTFLIKRNNTDRKGLIYYKHLSYQSFVNYIVKTTMSGIISSVGVKKNRKIMKQYKKELKNSNMPPVSL